MLSITETAAEHSMLDDRKSFLPTSVDYSLVAAADEKVCLISFGLIQRFLEQR